MLTAKQIASWTALLLMNACSLKVMLHFFQHRHHLLVRNRSPILALVQGIALLTNADALIVQAILLSTANKQASGVAILLICYVTYGAMLFALPTRGVRVIVASDLRLRECLGFVLQDSFCAAYCVFQSLLWLAVGIAVVVWSPADKQQFFVLVSQMCLFCLPISA